MNGWKTVSVVVLAIAIFGCQKPQKPKQSQQVRKRIGDFKSRVPSKLTAEQQKKVVAIVGPAKITLGDLERHLNRQPRYIRARYSSLDQKKKLLNDLVRFEALALEAKQKGLDSHPDVMQVMKRMMVSKLLQSELRNQVKLADISEDAIKKYYEEHITEFKQDAKVRLAHIVVKTEEEATKLLKEIKEAIGNYRYKTQQVFRVKARKHSLDKKSGSLGGDLRYYTTEGPVSGNTRKIPRNLLVEGFKMKRVNDISGPHKTTEGYHILLLVHKRPKIHRDFKSVRRYIQSRLYRKKRLDSRNSYIESLKKKANIKLFDTHLSLLKAPSLIPTFRDIRKMRHPRRPMRKRGLHKGHHHGPGKHRLPKRPLLKKPEPKKPAPEKKSPGKTEKKEKK